MGTSASGRLSKGARRSLKNRMTVSRIADGDDGIDALLSSAAVMERRY